jgi:hypothetical protein
MEEPFRLRSTETADARRYTPIPEIVSCAMEQKLSAAETHPSMRQTLGIGVHRRSSVVPVFCAKA